MVEAGKSSLASLHRCEDQLMMSEARPAPEDLTLILVFRAGESRFRSFQFRGIHGWEGIVPQAAGELL